ncbi:MAG: hypothetical protein K0U98_19655 [Deltaproteobacteria bacterium]|nr:hypothetical protein [Deltaproteobacteria bacterium]
MNRSTRTPLVSSSVLVGAVFCLLSAAQAFASENCISFQDLEHCSIGSAVLETSPEGLVVSGLGSEGEDGVSTQFTAAQHWRMRARLGSAGDQQLSFTFGSGGEAISRVILEQQGDSLRMGAEYTGAGTASSFSVLVYNDGQFEGGAGGIFFPGPDGTPDELDEFWTELIWLLLDLEVGFQIAPNGGCELDIYSQNVTEVRLPNGQVVFGDEVRLVEEVEGPGHYPYMGFDAVHTQGTVDSLTILEEVIQGAW